MKVLAIDPQGLWAGACQDAAARAGHVLHTCAQHPQAHDAETLFAEAVVAAWSGSRALEIWLRQLRAQAPWLPVLVLIEPGGEVSLTEALEAGAVDGLLLPVRPDELMVRLSALSKRPESRRSHLHIGDVRLDLGKQEASVSGEPVLLTATEWRIVSLLADGRGAFVDSQRIAAALSNARSAPVEPAGRHRSSSQDNCVSVHISHLRGKLGATSIESKRGLGYRLAD